MSSSCRRPSIWLPPSLPAPNRRLCPLLLRTRPWLRQSTSAAIHPSPLPLPSPSSCSQLWPWPLRTSSSCRRPSIWLAAVALASTHVFILSAPFDLAPSLFASSQSLALPPAASNSALASATHDVFHPAFSAAVAVAIVLLAAVALLSMHAFILSAPFDSAPSLFASSQSPALPPARSNSALASATH